MSRACRISRLQTVRRKSGGARRLSPKKGGYNEWAETNNIIVLYPQTEAIQVDVGLASSAHRGQFRGLLGLVGSRQLSLRAMASSREKTVTKSRQLGRCSIGSLDHPGRVAVLPTASLDAPIRLGGGQDIDLLGPEFGNPIVPPQEASTSIGRVASLESIKK